MKRILLAFVLLFAASGVHAQLKGFSIGPYIEAAWPEGDFRARNGNGQGIGVTADLRLPARWSLTASAGYLYFRKPTAPEHLQDARSVSSLPLRAGIKYRLPVVYLKAEAGTVRYLNGEGASVILSPGVGIRILGLDVQGSYESWLRDQDRFWSLRLAYHF